MAKTLILTSALLTALPVLAQESVGTVTATVGGEERTYVITQGGAEPTSSWRRDGGEVLVDIVAHPDRTPREDGPMLRLQFAVTGMGPTAEPAASRVTYVAEGEAPLLTGEGSSEVSLTAFGMTDGTLSLAGNFASQLMDEQSEALADLAIEGDFQASLRQSN
ncbi:hypothetical protein [Roseitranquillus sediminis]|uniref:hypothetical protein n=1 Tax=Roseitranquillus sediminis TaxID=2809051 RepID=UPI001D0C7EB4|nr:hypothetical protein [Roseitranquillus sediminis]MBM9596277.1 hypothetical protein [Roseitranquillus sediminis]